MPSRQAVESRNADFSAAVAHHKAGQTAEAAVGYERTIAENPAHVGALFNLAAVTAERGDLEEAARLYGRVLEVVPEDPETLSNLGNLMQHMGRLDEAADCYRRALVRNPTLAAAHVNYGRLLAGQGRTDEAIESYRAALRVAPAMTQAHCNLGVALWKRGRFAEAREAFQEAVRLDPRDAEARANLGNALSHDGERRAAAEQYRAAIALKPDWPQVHYNLAALMNKMGEPDEAERAYRRALELKPDYFEAMSALGVLLSDKGDGDEASQLFERCLKAGREDASVLFHLGNLCHERKQYEAAIEHYRAAIRLDDRVAEIHNNLAVALESLGRTEEALAATERGLEIDPRSSALHNTLGNSLSTLLRHDEAIAAYRRAVELDPEFTTALNNLGNALRVVGRIDEADRVLRRCLEIAPDDPATLNNTGLLLQSQSRNDEAIEVFRRALEADPNHVESLNNLAISYQSLGRYAEAVQLYRDLLERKPDQIEVLFNLGNLLQVMGRYDESVVVFMRAVQADPDYNAAYPYLAHGLSQQCSWTNLDAVIDRMLSNAEAELAAGTPVSVSGFALLNTRASMKLRCAVARDSTARTAHAVRDIKARAAYRYSPPSDGRLRIGYLSPDFRFHSVAVAFRGLLEAHDRDRFRFHGYSLAPLGHDGFTSFFAERFDRFHDLSGMSFEEAGALINREGVDILVDLAGPTRFSRPEILALQPAPIQAHYLGYSSTVGGRYIQYLITDRQQVAPGMDEYFAEELVYLPETFMAATRAEISDAPMTREMWGLPEKGFVFANFNAHYKFDPRMFGIWMRLLKHLPGSVLWLLRGTPTSERNLRKEAETRGVSADRLVFAERYVHPYHLARHRLADLALDNLYHGGGVTTVDALWVGLPVLTVAGESPPSRNGASLLAAIGLDDMITESLEAYEARAVELATRPEALAELRARLEANRDTHPLFDTERLTRHLERAYRMMWDNYVAGGPPRTIEVPALPSKV